jgi:hypothetical protein
VRLLVFFHKVREERIRAEIISPALRSILLLRRNIVGLTNIARMMGNPEVSNSVKPWLTDHAEAKFSRRDLLFPNQPTTERLHFRVF